MQRKSWNLLCKSDKVFMVGIHVSQLAIDQDNQLLLAELLALADLGADYALGLFSEARISIHLKATFQNKKHKSNQVFLTFSVHILTTFDSSCTTKSTHFKEGSLRREICFLTMASKAMSGVKRPTWKMTRGG